MESGCFFLGLGGWMGNIMGTLTYWSFSGELTSWTGTGTGVMFKICVLFAIQFRMIFVISIPNKYLWHNMNKLSFFARLGFLIERQVVKLIRQNSERFWRHGWSLSSKYIYYCFWKCKKLNWPSTAYIYIAFFNLELCVWVRKFSPRNVA